jgi:hypothetical protein
MSGSLIQQYAQQQPQSGGSLLIPGYTQPNTSLLNIKADPGYWGQGPKPAPAPVQQAAAPAAAQQQPTQMFSSPNAAAQDQLDAYAKALTGTGMGSLGNGPIDPGAFMLLQQINPQMAASIIGSPYSPFGYRGGGGAGGQGGPEGDSGMQGVEVGSNNVSSVW